MPVGAGGCPAGTSQAGYGVVAGAPAPDETPLPDPSTGLSQTGRYIDQTTGDYTFTVDGRVQGMPTVYQLVLLAIENVKLSSLTEKGPNYRQVVTAILQDALADLVASQQVEIRSIVVIDLQPGQNPDATVAMLFWRDLTTGANGQPIPVKR